MSCRHSTVVAAVLGGTLALAAPADAAVVALDLTALSLSGLNAGVAAGSSDNRSINPPGGNSFIVYNDGIKGMDELFGIQFANVSGSVELAKFTTGSFIGGSYTDWSPQGYFYEAGSTPSISAPNFGPNSFIGFRIANGSDWNYGYLEALWDGTNFQFLSGEYESTVNTAIQVPAPGAAALLAMAGLTGRRRRRA